MNVFVTSISLVNSMRQLVAVLAVMVVFAEKPVLAQQEAPRHEFRGAWIATVINLDWPTSRFSSTQTQRNELHGMIEKLHEAGVNAVFFQIRSESDAMYNSALEPWSFYLTGQQGRPPEPFYDPLAYAIQLAHERGMELHAWMNPFRVERSVGNYALHDSHVAARHPEWLIQINSISILNPGIPEARQYIVDVIEDVVERYDIDGIHFDDYFYPYPPNEIDLEDLDAFNTYAGAMPLFDWRRDNIDRFVKAVSESIQALKPDVKFGISPFGIWKNGVPDGIVGLSAYDVLFGDAVKWMNEGWIDYLAPQLYWPFGGGQDFALLAPWWVSVSNGRHIYPGLGAYRSARETASGTLFGPNEIPNQITFSRNTDGIEGNVLFRAENITRYSSQGLSTKLKTDLYLNTAHTPVMAWRDLFPPEPPLEVGLAISTKQGVGVVWSPGPGGFVEPRKYAVYRIQSEAEPIPRDVTNKLANLLGVTYNTWFDDSPPVSTTPFWYLATALSANSVESTESNMVMFLSTGTATELAAPVSFDFESVAPNPVWSVVTIRYSLERSEPVSLRVYDILGRQVARILDTPHAVRGNHRAKWHLAGSDVASGTYFIVLQVGEMSSTKPISVIR